MKNIISVLIEKLISHIKFKKIKNSISKNENKKDQFNKKRKINLLNERALDKSQKNFHMKKQVVNNGVSSLKVKKKPDLLANDDSIFEKNTYNKDKEKFDLREKPDSKSKKIGIIREGDRYEELESVPHWIKIYFNGKEAYLSKISANKMNFIEKE